MASWDLTELSRLLQGMQNDLEVLKREHLDKFTTIKYQKGLAAAATDFVDATLDPHQEVKNIGRCYTLCTALKICLDLSLVEQFPKDGAGVDVSILARNLNSDKTLLVAVLNILSKKGIFKQHGPSTWSHSVRSMTLLESPFNDLLSSLLDESFKSSVTLPETLQKSGYQLPSPGRTAFNECHNTDLDFYKYCVLKDVEKGARFSRAMEQNAKSSMRFFEVAYPLHELTDSALIIDVAGGNGYASKFLAERLPRQNFLVCDYQNVIDRASKHPRIQYIAHDMFDPYAAPVLNREGQRVFLLKQILHDWSDEQCVRILINIMDVLGPSDLVLILDSVKPTECISLSTAMSEMMVIGTFGGHHRTFAEFERLVHLAQADAHIKSFFANAGQYDDFMVLEVRKST